MLLEVFGQARLREEGVRTCLQRATLDGTGWVACEDQYRERSRPRVAPEQSRGRDAVHTRHRKVHHNNVGPERPGEVYTLPTIVCHTDGIAETNGGGLIPPSRPAEITPDLQRPP